jgi:hypothetical protein
VDFQWTSLRQDATMRSDYDGGAGIWCHGNLKRVVAASRRCVVLQRESVEVSGRGEWDEVAKF